MFQPPVIWPSGETPPDEIEPLKDLYANLWGVYYNVEAWGSSLELLVFSRQKHQGIAADLLRRWSFIAANECVHQLHHLRERLALIKGHKVRACPSLMGSVDTKALRTATRKLDEFFPHIDAMRHAIAHSGANDVRPEKHASESGWLMTQLDDNGRYSTYYEGRERSIEINGESLGKLESVAATFLGGFIEAARTLELQGYADER
jgi:hypothetical protein